jgi:hypothetical protein
MGYAQKRVGRDGKPRYTAVYQDIRGERRSAGTFSSKKDANAAWQRAAAKIGEGRLNDPRRGRQTFRRYVTEEWLPHHVIEVTTRETYIVPSLFATFMTAADAAVDGRQATTLAPSLSPASGVTPVTTPPAAAADIDTITAALAALGELLGERLAHAAVLVTITTRSTTAPSPGGTARGPTSAAHRGAGPIVYLWAAPVQR